MAAAQAAATVNSGQIAVGRQTNPGTYVTRRPRRAVDLRGDDDAVLQVDERHIDGRVFAMDTLLAADWLKGAGEQGLVDLLRRRPEALAPPVPSTLAELAERLMTQGSVHAALRRQNLPTLQVAEAVAALGGRTDRAALDRLLGDPAPEPVEAALARLRDHALLLPGPVIALVPAARTAWPDPLGLGIPAAALMSDRTADDLRAVARRLGLRSGNRKAQLFEAVTTALCDPERVRAMVAAAPPAARELLRKAATTGEHPHEYDYFSPRYAEPRTPAQWAIAHGLVVHVEWEGCLLMPAEVALALRGPAYAAPFDPEPPPVRWTAADPAVVARDAAAAGSAIVRLVAALLDDAGRTPVTMLRAGGVGTRELRRLAKRLGCTETEVRLGIVLAHEAGLLSLSDGQAAPTAGYDRWLGNEPAERLAELLRAWWRSPLVPLANDRAVDPADAAPGTPALRAALMAAAARPDRSAVTDPAELATLTTWEQPFGLGDPASIPDRALGCWREASLLGVVATGAVSDTARALLDDADLTAALGEVGTAQRTVRLQADLSAVVTGTPAPDLAALLDTAADVESRGTATTWRFSPASVRRALDAGATAEQMLADLAEVAAGGVPQPLAYLINDVARRHGAVRASKVACCLRSDQVALLTEIAADRRLRGLRLRQLAPTVLASDKPLADTLDALRKAGYAPVAETTDGTPVIERATRHRASPPPTTGQRVLSRRAPSPKPGHTPESLARALLAGPTTAPTSSPPSLPLVRKAAPNLSAGEARILAHAIDEGRPVSIGYVNRNGNPSTRIIEQLVVRGGALSAWCRLREDQRWFDLAGILAVEPVSDE